MSHFKGALYGVIRGEELPQVNTLYYAIDHTKVDSTLTNFPVGIIIAADTNFMNNRSGLDWQNLHAYNVDTETELYVEVEKFDTINTEAIIWVKVDSVSSSVDTVIRIEMTTSSSYIGEPGDTAAQNVWDSDFVAVYHFAEDPTGGSGCVLDSVGVNNGTPGGTMTSGDLVDGDFGKGLDFDGTDDYIDCGSDTTIDNISEKTIEAFVNLDTFGDGGFGRIASKAISNDNGWNFYVTDDYDTIAYIHGWTTANGSWRGDTNALDTTDPHAVTVTYDDDSTGNDPTFFVDETELTTTEATPPTGSLDGDGSSDLWIGARNNSGSDREFDGVISELRISKIIRTDAWIKATHANLLGTLVAQASIYAGHAESYIGFADEIDAYKEFVPVSFSSEIGFSDEIGDVGFKFDWHHFGTLREGLDGNDGGYGDSTLQDYWVEFDGNDGIYWDQDLDTSDFELHAIFRIDETDFGSSFPTGHEVVFKSGNAVGGVSLSYKRLANYQPWLYYTGAVSSVNTYIAVNLKNISFSTGVWYEVFATASKLVIREYGNESNSVTAVGTCNVGYTDYYQSVGVSVGACPVLTTTSGYAKCSVRDLDFYRAGKIDMPTDVNLYPFPFYIKFGNNYDGNPNGGSAGTPTVYDDWVTFDGNDAEYFATAAPLEGIDISDMDVYIVFRLEEDHLDVLDGYYIIWTIGDATDGLELGIYDRFFAFVSRNNGTLKESIVSVYNLEMDVWYEAFLSDSKWTVREQATPANGFTVTATIDVNANYTSGYHAIACTVGAYIWEGGSGSWHSYTAVSFKELALHKQGGLTFPSDLSAPVVGPIYRWNWGSDVGGTYSWSQGGGPTNNTDNIEGDGNDALYDPAGNYDTPSTGWGLVVEFEADSLSGPQVIWKTGDEVNGLAIGFDSSGNFGLFGRSSSSLTSITFSASTYMSTATKYLVYATLAKVMLVDEYGSLVYEATGTVTMTDSTGGNDNQGVLGAVYGSPISGNNSTWNDYFDGRLYSHEIWEYDDFSFPETNWYHAEGNELGLADTIDGEITSAVVGISETIGFNDTVDGVNVADTFDIDEDIGFSDTVVGSQVATQKESSSTLGLNDSVTGSQVATQKESSSTLGLDDTISVDHIDETTGEVAEDIAFSDTIDGYNSYSHKGHTSTLGLSDVIDGYNAVARKEVLSALGLNDEVGGHLEVKNVGLSETLGLTGTADAYNAVSEHEVQATLGLSDSIDGRNIIKRGGIEETLGFNDTINANITEIEGHSNTIGFADFVFGTRTTRSVGISEEIAFNDEVGGGDPFQPDNSSEIGFDDTIGVSYHPLQHLSENIWFNDIIGVVRAYEVGIEETIGFTVNAYAENAGNLKPSIPANMTYKFYLTLTGANDSLEDVELDEIKTLQLRMKTDGESSYLGISLIYSEAKETAIEARKNGTLVLEMASVYEGIEILREELIEVDLSDSRYDLGGTSRSITLNGYAVIDYSVNDVAYVEYAIQKRINQDGRINYRFARPDFYLRPGWNAVYNLEKFIVDEVSFYVGDNNFYMDIYFDPSTLTGKNENEIYRIHSIPTDRTRKFYVTLTGSADGQDDYTFTGINSIQIRKSAGKTSYANASIVYTKEHEDAIAARPNGDIVIDVVDGIGASSQEIISVNFNDISYSFLPSNRTFTISGYRQVNYSSGATYTPENVIAERVQENGDIYIRSISVNVALAPGYLVTYGGRAFIVGEVTFDFSAISETMGISNTANIDVDRYFDPGFGLTGESVSNTFYRDNHGESELGILGEHHASLNAVENAYHDTCDIGFTAFIGYELNPEE